MESHALLVWQGGALQLEHYYPGHDANSITPTQSMHKSVLALLVGIAIDQGLIRSVDDTAATYIEEWAGDERSKITIRQMLQQASGIDFPGFTGLLQMTLGGDVAPFTFSRGIVEPGGQRFEYNNINPQVLGILIQRVSGKPYSQYLAENLWQYVSEAEGKVLIDSEKHGIPITFCCLDAPARSWLRFGLLHLDGGRVGDRQVVPGPVDAGRRHALPHESQLRLLHLARHDVGEGQALQLQVVGHGLPLGALRGPGRDLLRRLRRAARLHRARRSSS